MYVVIMEIIGYMTSTRTIVFFTPESYFFVFYVFSTGLVRLYIAGLSLRSCQTIGAPSVQGSAQCLYFRFWLQQDSNPRPGEYNADALPLRHFDPIEKS